MKNHFQRIFRLFGLELHRANGRGTLGGALRQLEARGFFPQHIIDGGASDGRWSLEAQRYFPTARYTLVEPLEAYVGALQKVPNGHVVTAALADQAGHMDLYLGGAFNSSLRPRGTQTRRVPTVTLDSLIVDPAATLVKLDLEEAEYPVLGASEQLPQVGAVILECTFANLPRYTDLMQQRGFRVYQIVDQNWDRVSGNMSQVDILFVPQNSPL